MQVIIPPDGQPAGQALYNYENCRDVLNSLRVSNICFKTDTLRFISYVIASVSTLWGMLYRFLFPNLYVM